jgi:TolA-binding protein
MIIRTTMPRWSVAAASVFALHAAAAMIAPAAETPGSSDAARAAYASAAALQNREAWDLAGEEWAALVTDHPADPLALKGRYYLGICQLKNGDWPAAAQTFRAVVDSKSDAATIALARWELGRGAFQAAQNQPAPAAYEAAADSLREFLEKSPGQPQTADALFFLGESLWQAGKREPAIEAWQRFVRDHASSPRLPEVLYALGVGQAELKQPAAAAVTLRRFAESFPNHKLTDDVAVWRADAALAAGAPADAERILVPLAAGKGPRAVDALERLGSARWSQKNWVGAAEAFGTLATRHPAAPQAGRAAASAGRAYVEAGNLDKARPLLEQAAAAGGAVAADAAHSLALLELDAKQPARAVDITTRAIAALTGKPDRDDTRLARLELDRADALWEIPARKGEAAAAYAAIIERYPNEKQTVLAARSMTALALLEQGKPAEAFATAEAFLQTCGDAEVGQRLLDVKAIRAEALLAQGKPAAAAEAYRELIAGHATAPQRATWQLREGVALAAARQWQKTHDVLSAAVPLLKGDAAAEALLLDATALVELNQQPAAVKVLAVLEQQHAAWPRRNEALLLGVRARREAGDKAAALELAEKLVKEFPEWPLADVAWYRLGQLRQEAGRFDEAITAYAKARVTKPKGTRAPWAALATGWCHEAKGRLPEAIAAWTDLIDSYPDSTAASSALLARGDARQRRGDFSGGLADAEQFLKVAKPAAAKGNETAAGEARMLAGLCLVGAQRYPDAVRTFQTLLDAQPSFPAADRAVFEMALAQSLAGTRDDAEKTFRRLVEKFPGSSRVGAAWLEIGEARFDAKAWDEAAQAYAAAVAAATSRKDSRELLEQARHKLGWSHSMRKDHAAAAKAFAEQVAADPTGALAADARAMLGESLFQTGQHAEAAKALAAALATPAALSSDDLRGLALIRASECAAKTKQWQESLTFAEQLATAQPQSPYAGQARYAAAWAQQNLGQLDRSLAAYRALADSGRSELAARSRLMEGEVLFEQGKHKDAIKAFFKVAYGFGEQQAPIAFHPWQAQATFEAARCFEVLGKPEQAAKLYAEMVDRYPDSQQTPAARKRLEALEPADAPSRKQAS